MQEIKNRTHNAYAYRYHLIALLRLSRFTHNTRQFFLANGLYIVIICVFVALCILAPVVKNTELLTVTNILNILAAVTIVCLKYVQKR